jgi:hypothetical protein
MTQEELGMTQEELGMTQEELGMTQEELGMTQEELGMTQEGDRKKNVRAKGCPQHFAISYHWVQGSPLPREA